MPFRLEFFAYEIHHPASRLWYRAAEDETQDRAMARNAMFEAYLWLQLGARTGFFERRIAEDLAKEGFARFFASLAGEENEDLRALREREVRPLRLWDPEGRADLAARFPEHDTTLRHAVLGKGLWLPPQEFVSPGSLRAPMQALLSGAARLSADALASDCSAALGFWSDDWWERTTEGQASAEMVATIADKGIYDGAPAKAVVYAGFFRLLRHLHAFHEIITAIQECEAIAHEDSVRLLRGVRELHAWRLDLRRASTKQRFRQVVLALNDALDDELMVSYLETGEEGYERAMGWLRKTADEVVQAWGPEQALAPPAEAVLERV